MKHMGNVLPAERERHATPPGGPVGCGVYSGSLEDDICLTLYLLRPFGV